MCSSYRSIASASHPNVRTGRISFQERRARWRGWEAFTSASQFASHLALASFKGMDCGR